MSTPQLATAAPADGPRTMPDPARYTRWRVATLVLVHLLAAAHIAHWRLAGRTLAPLELNEVVYSLELGIVTAGFLLMAAATLAAALCGRFFCAWACHLLALQDVSAWLLAKLGIRAKPVRSRTLRVAPFAVMAYMFVWPQVVRLWHGEPLPRFHVQQPDQFWASFQTDDFWRNLPGPWIAGLTFLTCGGLIVYLLGSRAFCTTGCPYGAVFALVDRLSPVRIVRRGDCSDCGRCTAVCQSGVLVHQEVQALGRVVDPACLRDLDCVAVCPEGALRVGFARPAFLQSLRTAGHRRGFTWRFGEDLLAGAVMLLTVLIARGLYDAVPFLMAVGLGAAAAALTVTTGRLLRARDFAFRRLTLRRGGRWTGAGIGWLAAVAATAALWLHSGFIRWHEAAGQRAFDAVRAAKAQDDRDAGRVALTEALAHLETCAAHGLFDPPDLHRRLAALYTLAGRSGDAIAQLSRVLTAAPSDHETRLRLAWQLLRSGQTGDAARELATLEAVPDLPPDLRTGVAAARAQMPAAGPATGR